MTVCQQDAAATGRDRVELRVPADPAYLTVLRTACAGLAARLDFTLDEIEDLRIAVDEACSLLLAGVPAHWDGGELVARFDLGAAAATSADPASADPASRALEVRVSGPAPRLPERSSFAWAVLDALTSDVTTGTDAGGSFVRLRHAHDRRVR